ncbi:MAG: nuclear transport factor 2 family protein [Novosphingobium sp.]|nr:nuclear transport factor 2 family protein [Novosphingobium sp.]
MGNASHQIVRRFIQAMSDGNITDELVTADFKVWILGTPELVDRDAYADGIALLPRVFPDRLAFTIHSLTAEDDRVIAEFSGHGVTRDGKTYDNDYLYLFKIRDGKVYFLAEYLNLDEMRGTLIPAMMSLPAE